MKVALFDDYTPGVVIEDRIIDASDDLREVMSLPGELRMLGIIETFQQLRERLESSSGPARSVRDVRLRAPVPRPSKILCAAANFREGTDAPRRDLEMFLKSPSSILDPDGTVMLPPDDVAVFHHEAELAVVMGARASDVPVEEAANRIFGYTCFIDVSARGLGYGIGFRAKSFDTFGPIGPWIVTSDEMGTLNDVRVRLSVDDVLRQDYGMADIEHPVPAMVSWASHVATLLPGDVLACGTNHQGLGPLQDGERVDLEIDRIGTLSVRVQDRRQRRWDKGVDEALAGRARQRRYTPDSDDVIPPWDRGSSAPRSEPRR
jgi:2-keto-4-pentenoate hydratase/2-oxohepta-3-ene-1,7-dioic acid hydratase in catechol pathway